MNCTRRDLAKFALSAVPLARAAAAIDSKFHGVQIGAITYSFGPTPAKEIIPAMASIGLGEVELMSEHCEALAGAPAMPRRNFGGPRRPGHPRPQPTPEQQQEMRQALDALREWRRSTSPATFKAVRKQFNDAGIELQILCFNQRGNTPDDEIDYAFQMARALGVRAISSSSTVSFAKRVAPFADKYKIMWGGHGHSNVKDPEEFSTPTSFETIMSYSRYIGVNLDIGHFTAAGFDAVSYMKQIHSRITNIHLKDRKKNQGPNMPWGQGETPIREVLQTMAREKYKFPANIELEYPIPEGSTRVAEVGKCLEFCKEALA